METATLNSSRLKAKALQRGEDAGEIELRDLQRYYALLNCHLLETIWTEGEANLICEALESYQLEQDPEKAKTLWKQVHAAVLHNRLDQKWQINRETFHRKVQALSHLEAVALVDAVERYWLSAKLFPQESLHDRLMRVDLIKCCDSAL